MPSRRVLFLAACAALALASCGRKGALDLPADVQAERAARRAALDDAAARSGRRLSQEGAPPSAPQPQLGDIGRRPPADYPFFLDPLL